MAKKNIWCKLFKVTTTSNAFSIISHDIKSLYKINLPRSSIIGVWTILLCEGINRNGKLSNLHELKISLEFLSGLDISLCEVILEQFIHHNMIHVDDNMNLFISNWTEYQAPIKTDNTTNERSARYREKLKLESGNIDGNMVTKNHAVTDGNMLPLPQNVTNNGNMLPQNVTDVTTDVTSKKQYSTSKKAVAMRLLREKRKDEHGNINHGVTSRKNHGLDIERKKDSSSRRKEEKNVTVTVTHESQEKILEKEFKILWDNFPIDSISFRNNFAETYEQFIKARSKIELEPLTEAIHTWYRETTTKYKTSLLKWLKKEKWHEQVVSKNKKNKYIFREEVKPDGTKIMVREIIEVEVEREKNLAPESIIWKKERKMPLSSQAEKKLEEFKATNISKYNEIRFQTLKAIRNPGLHLEEEQQDFLKNYNDISVEQ